MNRCAIFAEWAAMIMFLGAQPGLTLRSDFRTDKEKRSQAVTMEVPLGRSPAGGLEDFSVYGIDGKQWRIPSPKLKEDNGINVDAVLVSDLSKGNFKDNRAEWKVESDGSSTPSLQPANPQTAEVAPSKTQESVPLLHRWRTQEIINSRKVHLALAIGLVMGLLVAVAVYLYRAAGGTWGKRYGVFSKAEGAEITPLRKEAPKDPFARDAEAADFLNKKIQARLDRFEERLLKAANNLKENGANSPTNSTCSTCSTAS